MEDFINASWWVPRYHCGYFPYWLTCVYIISNLLIWLSYEKIARRLSIMENEGVYIMPPSNLRWFKRFLRFCARGHLLDGVIVFIWPHYMFFAFWHSMTATISIIAAWNFRSMVLDIVGRKDGITSGLINEMRSFFKDYDSHEDTLFEAKILRIKAQLEILQQKVTVDPQTKVSSKYVKEQDVNNPREPSG